MTPSVHACKKKIPEKFPHSNNSPTPYTGPAGWPNSKGGVDNDDDDDYTNSNLPLLTLAEQLGGGTADGQLARLLDLGLEDDAVALLPHLGHERLAGEHGAGEAHLDVLEAADLLVDGLAGDAEEAEPGGGGRRGAARRGGAGGDGEGAGT